MPYGVTLEARVVSNMFVWFFDVFYVCGSDVEPNEGHKKLATFWDSKSVMEFCVNNKEKFPNDEARIEFMNDNLKPIL